MKTILAILKFIEHAIVNTIAFAFAVFFIISLAITVLGALIYPFLALGN